MGNSNSQNNYNEIIIKDPNDCNLKFLNTVKTSLGIVKLYINQTNGSLLYEYSKQLENDKEKYFKLIDFIKNRPSDVNILEIKYIHIKESAGWCTPQIINCYVDHYYLLLNELLLENEKYFNSENKFWLLIINLIDIIVYYKNKNLYINLDSIFFNKNNFGIIDPLFLENNNFILLKRNSISLTCSPEVFNQLELQNNEFFITDKSKDYLYSLGLVILKIIFGKDCLKKFYNYEENNTNNQIIDSLINKLTNFSDIFRTVMTDILNKDEISRINPNTLQNILKECKNTLLDKNLFIEKDKEILKFYNEKKNFIQGHIFQINTGISNFNKNNLALTIYSDKINENDNFFKSPIEYEPHENIDLSFMSKESY